MNRRQAAFVGGALMLVSACGQAGATTSSATPSSSAPGRGARDGAGGELVQVKGETLLLSGPNGDTTVMVSGSTTYLRISTGTVADIGPGVCITAAGPKDGSGVLAVATVRLSPKVNGSCPAPQPSRVLPSGTAPAGPRQGGNRSSVRGEVTAVAGMTVTIRDTSGQLTTISVPTTVRVVKTSPAAASDLSEGNCLLAVGSRSAAGVVSARTVSIVPAGPSGCASGAGFGRGGFGGGGG